MATGFILDEAGFHVLDETGVDAVVQEDYSDGSSTGTLAYTNVNDSIAAAGTTTPTGTLAKTNANDTSAASGTTTPTGTLAKTNNTDSVVGTGTTTPTGTLAKTNNNDTVVASGSSSGAAAPDTSHHLGGGRWPQGGIELAKLQKQYQDSFLKQKPPKPATPRLKITVAVGYATIRNLDDISHAFGDVDPYNLLLEDDELLLLV